MHSKGAKRLRTSAEGAQMTHGISHWIRLEYNRRLRDEVWKVYICVYAFPWVTLLGVDDSQRKTKSPENITTEQILRET